MRGRLGDWGKGRRSEENIVSTVYQRIYAPLRNEIFHSLTELNHAINQALLVHNEQPFQKRAGCRRSYFETQEKALLSPLPNEAF